ncbi:MAG: hypothetical protein GYA14_15940 [Ignavibacteria bacterium]|nr:hypothetical protein [Ignavibacteria bacterium]
MCLITEQKEPIITKRGMTVYKVVERIGDDIISPCIHFMWRQGVLEKTRISKRIAEPRRVNYADVIAQDYYDSKLSSRNYLEISTGFHFAFKQDRLACCWGLRFYLIIMKFRIPKGSEIYKDATGLGVTNQIMML